MALIKNSNAAQMAREAIVLDLGDLSRQADVILRVAKAKAEQIVEAARAERERLMSDAAAIGKAEGLAEGLAEGHRVGVEQGRATAVEEHRAAIAALNTGWMSGLGVFVESRERMLAEAKRDVLALALGIGEKVTKRVIESDAAVVAAQLEAVLNLVLRPTRLQVKVHPSDRSTIEAAMPALVAQYGHAEHVQIVDDATLARGSCVAKLADGSGAGGAGSSGASGGSIDASIETQLNRIVEALLPGYVRATVARADSAVDPVVERAPAAPKPEPDAERGS